MHRSLWRNEFTATANQGKDTSVRREIGNKNSEKNDKSEQCGRWKRHSKVQRLLWLAWRNRYELFLLSCVLNFYTDDWEQSCLTVGRLPSSWSWCKIFILMQELGVTAAGTPSECFDDDLMNKLFKTVSSRCVSEPDSRLFFTSVSAQCKGMRSSGFTCVWIHLPESAEKAQNSKPVIVFSSLAGLCWCRCFCHQRDPHSAFQQHLSLGVERCWTF